MDVGGEKLHKMLTAGLRKFCKLRKTYYFKIKEYCDASSGHGMRYITEEGRHWIERALWICLVLMG